MLESERCVQDLEEFMGAEAVAAAVRKLQQALPQTDVELAPELLRRVVGVWASRLMEDVLADVLESAWGWGGCRSVGDWDRAQEMVEREERRRDPEELAQPDYQGREAAALAEDLANRCPHGTPYPDNCSACDHEAEAADDQAWQEDCRRLGER